MAGIRTEVAGGGIGWDGTGARGERRVPRMPNQSASRTVGDPSGRHHARGATESQVPAPRHASELARSGMASDVNAAPRGERCRAVDRMTECDRLGACNGSGEIANDRFAERVRNFCRMKARLPDDVDLMSDGQIIQTGEFGGQGGRYRRGSKSAGGRERRPDAPSTATAGRVEPRHVPPFDRPTPLRTPGAPSEVGQRRRPGATPSPRPAGDPSTTRCRAASLGLAHIALAHPVPAGRPVTVRSRWRSWP